MHTAIRCIDQASIYNAPNRTTEEVGHELDLKLAIASLGAAAALLLPCAAGATTAEQLLKLCELRASAGDYVVTPCETYIEAVADVNEYRSKSGARPHCVPAEARYDQMTSAFVKHMRANPEAAQHPAHVEVTRALGAAFPCAN